MENKEIIDKIVEHAKAIADLVSQQNPANVEKKPVEKECENCEFVSIVEAADMVSEKMGYPKEERKTIMNFLLNRIKNKKFLSYRFEKGTRLFKLVSPDIPSWLMIPAASKENPDFEFTSAELHFITKAIPKMLFDLWIGNKPSFDKEYLGYKDYVAKMKEQR